MDHACGTAAARASVCAYMDMYRAHACPHMLRARAQREKIESMNGGKGVFTEIMRFIFQETWERFLALLRNFLWKKIER